MIASLENLVNEYLGVIVFKLDLKTTLIGNTWDAEYHNGLIGIIAFTKWSIPLPGAFRGCDRLMFILGTSPALGTNMGCMFDGATNFNQPLDFDTRNVTNMGCMFYKATNFNQPLDFDTSGVTNMEGMFYGATSFNQLLDFDTGNVTNMGRMFIDATSFNQALEFDTRNVTNMRGMFS